MTDRFVPIETLKAHQIVGLPPNVIFQATSNIRYYKLELFRLLIGTSSFKCIISDEIIVQRENYSKLPNTYNKNIKPKIGRYIGIDTKKMGKELTNNNNRGFYDEILKEYYSYFFETKKENHTTAFIHIYRILERIAICLPLVYAACSNDYKGVYNDFKKYILDDKTGELKVIQKFVSSFIDASILQSTVDIEIQPLQSNFHENHFNAIARFNLHESNTPFSQITFKYEKVLEFIIKVRNAYFHALTGSNNSFKADDIVYSQDFFKMINPLCCSWMSYLIIQVMKLELK
ncbi:hypothetical protein [Wohlfahrtiimonas larvae]|nr:hypothetical protein [Wohlfahrtiimonas larvae]